MKDLNTFSDMLRERAHWTNDIIHKGVFHQLGVMEETITDINLISIADKYGDFVLTEKFTRRQEGSISGADWIWVIGEPGSWIPFLIQAKIINPKTGNCRYLNYKDGRQREKLLDYAREKCLIPVYCIYSYIPQSFTPPELFDYPGRQKEDWACSFISPMWVRYLSAKGIKGQRNILEYCIPWMDPFNIDLQGHNPTGQAIADKLVSMRDGMNNKYKTAKTTKDKNPNSKSLQRINWVNLDAHHAVKQEIPRFICKMLKGFHDSSKDSVAGISIISSVPIKQIPELAKIAQKQK